MESSRRDMAKRRCDMEKCRRGVKNPLRANNLGSNGLKLQAV
jgi:hypothetical protein